MEEKNAPAIPGRFFCNKLSRHDTRIVPDNFYLDPRKLMQRAVKGTNERY